MLKINDTVLLLDEMQDLALHKGAVGVIVAEFVEPTIAYEVEFCNEDGETIAQAALRPDQIAKCM